MANTSQDVDDYGKYNNVKNPGQIGSDVYPLVAGAGNMADATDLTVPIRGIRATVAGNVKVTTAAGNARVLAFLAGETRWVVCGRVWVTGTTATGLDGIV